MDRFLDLQNRLQNRLEVLVSYKNFCMINVGSMTKNPPPSPLVLREGGQKAKSYAISQERAKKAKLYAILQGKRFSKRHFFVIASE